MTDSEIIKVWEYCAKNQTCRDCPLSELPSNCLFTLNKPTLDLINRQKEDIERLEADNKFLEDRRWKELSEVRAEAIKEFADKLKNMLGLINGFDYDCSTIFYHIDNLVKEMVGDSDGKR